VANVSYIDARVGGYARAFCMMEDMRGFTEVQDAFFGRDQAENIVEMPRIRDSRTYLVMKRITDIIVALLLSIMMTDIKVVDYPEEVRIIS